MDSFFQSTSYAVFLVMDYFVKHNIKTTFPLERFLVKHIKEGGFYEAEGTPATYLTNLQAFIIVRKAATRHASTNIPEYMELFDEHIANLSCTNKYL